MNRFQLHFFGVFLLLGMSTSPAFASRSTEPAIALPGVTRPLTELTPDLIRNIYKFLNVRELMRVRRTCASHQILAIEDPHFQMHPEVNEEDLPIEENHLEAGGVANPPAVPQVTLDQQFHNQALNPAPLTFQRKMRVWGAGLNLLQENPNLTHFSRSFGNTVEILLRERDGNYYRFAFQNGVLLRVEPQDPMSGEDRWRMRAHTFKLEENRHLAFLPLLDDELPPPQLPSLAHALSPPSPLAPAHPISASAPPLAGAFLALPPSLFQPGDLSQLYQDTRSVLDQILSHPLPQPRLGNPTPLLSTNVSPEPSNATFSSAAAAPSSASSVISEPSLPNQTFFLAREEGGRIVRLTYSGDTETSRIPHVEISFPTGLEDFLHSRNLVLNADDNEPAPLPDEE